MADNVVALRKKQATRYISGKKAYLFAEGLLRKAVVICPVRARYIFILRSLML